MMKSKLSMKVLGSLAMLGGISGVAVANGTMEDLATTPEYDDPSKTFVPDRTVLPIHPPNYEHITTLDARDATAPPRFTVVPPEGAPNVVIVLIDDIGFGASSAFGGAIETPVFESMADDGLRFNNFHTTALCSPTRASLMSGRNHHEVNVGSVMEVATGFPGNLGERPDNAKYFAETLRLNGYSTAAFGKWHETPTWEVSVSGPYVRWPTNSGFDRFYGFIGGETNQWDPVIFDGLNQVAKNDDPDYHFTTDMTNKAIDWVKFQQAMTPDKPFYIYYAPGAVHAPHHAPKEWIEKYDGQFDDGWLAYREKVFAQQKALGIIPENTKLAPMPDDIMEWEALSDQERELYSLQMEAFAGFTSHTDNEVGRLVDAINDLGELDDTLFIYIMGDNGSSGEGGLTGTFNELIHLNGIFDEETTESMLAKADDWGGPDSFPHYSAAWAVATDVPFTWTKQVAGDFGGNQNAMVMHWPNGFDAKGEIRSQFHHVNDVAATVLEATNLPQPKIVNGVEQLPLAGVSMLSSAEDADAPENHTTQYFEIFANRAIYSDGWFARVIHSAPWRDNPENTLQNDVWELYNTDDDFSLTNNLAREYPEKLKEMQDLFEKEAIANNVYPLDDRKYERFNAAVAGRPDLMNGRTSLTLSDGMAGIMENTFINEKNSSKTIVANVQLNGNDRGVILTQGGKFGGWALYMNEGKPAYIYNYFGLESYTIASPDAIDASTAEIKLQFDYDYDADGSGNGGLATLYVDGKKVAEGRVDKTEPSVYSADETADVGRDESTQVADKVFTDVDDSVFTGSITDVTISVPERKDS